MFDVLRAPALACVIVFGAATAHAEDVAMPAGVSEIFELVQAKTEFGGCVDAAMKQRQLDGVRLVDLIVERELTDELHHEVLGQFPDSGVWLKDFASKTADPTRLKAEQALHVLAAISADAVNADLLAPGDADPFAGMSAIHGFHRVVNRAMDNACEIPAAIVKAEGTVNRLEPLLMEADRVEKCAELEMGKRGLDEAAAYARLDADRDGQALRKHALTMLDALTLDAEHKRGIDRKRIGEIVLAYSFYAAMSFEVERIAQSTGLKAIYLDRALKSDCKPSEELIRFIGAPTRAN